MRKIQLVFGSAFLLTIVLFSPKLSLPTRVNNSPDGMVQEAQTSSYSVISQQSKEYGPIDDLARLSRAQNISLPFPGFTENHGQFRNNSIAYYCSMEDIWVGFSKSMILFTSIEPNSSDPIDFSITFPGSQEISPVGVGKKKHNTNYFYGNFRLINVPAWEELWYYDLYPNIDLRYYRTAQGLKYDLVIRPGGDPDQIAIKISQAMTLDVEDHLVSIRSRVQPRQALFNDTSLQVWQEDGTPVSARFIPKDRTGNAYGFQLGSFNVDMTLTIDPLWLPFSTFLGGAADDWNLGIAVDANGNTYVTGHSWSSDFPILNANQSIFGTGYDVFVTKLNATGDELVFSTFLGGTGSEWAYGIAVDDSGNSYITGHTQSSDFPMEKAYNGTYGGQGDVFVAKLNSTGNGLVFSTFLGGSDEWGMGIAVDSTGNCCITGYTNSSAFPTKNAYNATHGGDWDVFVAKFTAAGDDLVFSTFLGGTGWDEGTWITVDDDDNCYIVGDTNSSNFPIKNANQSIHAGGESDAFIAKLDPTGNNLLYSTFLGGSGVEYAYGIAVDNDGNSYFTGLTFSTDFPTANAYQSSHGGGAWDIFAGKLSATGDELLFSTYLGGSNNEYGMSIAVDNTGNCYITGLTNSNETDFPVKNAYQSVNGGDRDSFIVKLNSTGNGILFSTFLGGNGREWGYSLTIDDFGDCYVAGITESSDFPTSNAYNDTYGGMKEVYVAKLSFDAISPSIALSTPTNGSLAQSGTTIRLNLTDDESGLKDVLYTWDGLGNTSLEAPYNLSFPAGDGSHVLRVYVNDIAGNWAQALFMFTTDDTGPIITLNNPANASACQSDTTLDFTINDTVALSHVLYSWNETSNSTLSAPYDVMIPSDEGLHVLQIYANDTMGHWTWMTFCFITDDTSPLITLVDPINGSRRTSGTLIALNISDNTAINQVMFHWDQEDNNTLSAPFNIGFPLGDGEHILYLYAIDNASNWARASFVFITDNTGPLILLTNISNDSIHKSETIIALNITDAAGISSASYYWDASATPLLVGSFNVRLPPGDGQHVLRVTASDSLANVAQAVFVFTTDDTPPAITLNKPANDTTHLAGALFIADTVIDLAVADNTVLDAVLYHWDNKGNNTLNSPFNIKLPSSEGQHVLYVYANDTAGNWVSTRYVFASENPTLEIAVGIGAIGASIVGSVGIVKLWRRKSKARRRIRREPLIRKWDEP